MGEFVARPGRSSTTEWRGATYVSFAKMPSLIPTSAWPELIEPLTARRTLVTVVLRRNDSPRVPRALESGHIETSESLERMGFGSYAVASDIIDNFLGDVFEQRTFPTRICIQPI
jgi:hypothetical protein